MKRAKQVSIIAGYVSVTMVAAMLHAACTAPSEIPQQQELGLGIGEEGAEAGITKKKSPGGKGKKPRGYCGPDVTEAVDLTLQEINTTFHTSWNEQEQRVACRSLYNRPGGDDSTDSANLWDIYPLHEELGVGSDVRRWYGCLAVKGTGKCAKGVVYRGVCIGANYLNYIMWGAVNRICHDEFGSFYSPLWTLETAMALAQWWKILIWGDFTGAYEVIAPVQTGYACPQGGCDLNFTFGYRYKKTRYAKCDIRPEPRLPAQPLDYAWKPYHNDRVNPLQPLPMPDCCDLGDPEKECDGDDLAICDAGLNKVIEDCGVPGCAVVQGEAQCVCEPDTCADLGFDCGAADDGCGGTLDCGSCAAPDTCGGGGDPNVCGCQPQSCADLGFDCGVADDGCGTALDCGSCTAPNTCGGGGEPNVCGGGPSCSAFDVSATSDAGTSYAAPATGTQTFTITAGYYCEYFSHHCGSEIYVYKNRPIEWGDCHHSMGCQPIGPDYTLGLPTQWDNPDPAGGVGQSVDISVNAGDTLMFVVPDYRNTYTSDNNGSVQITGCI